VLSQEDRDGTTRVRLRWIGASGDRVGSDQVLLSVLGAAPGVVGSSLKRSAGQETLELHLGNRDWAEITRSAGAESVQVTLY
jgi:hypothetical protein